MMRPLIIKDITLIERVGFVMKGGIVRRNDLQYRER
jgi:hypothetical protein